MQELRCRDAGQKGQAESDREPGTYETNVGVGETKTNVRDHEHTRWKPEGLPD